MCVLCEAEWVHVIAKLYVQAKVRRVGGGVPNDVAAEVGGGTQVDTWLGACRVCQCAVVGIYEGVAEAEKRMRGEAGRVWFCGR